MKTTKAKKKNITVRAFGIMFLILVPILLILIFLSTHFDRKRENEQDEIKRETLVNTAANERLEVENADARFDAKLALLLEFTTDSLKEFVTEEGYTGPRMFEHGFVAEFRDGQLLLPDEFPEGDMQLTPELAEESIASGKMRTGRLTTAKGIPYYLSFGKIADSTFYVDMTEEKEYEEYLALYTSQSDSAMQAAVKVTGGIALFYRQQDNGIELLRQYGTDDQLKNLSGSDILEELKRKETSITLNGVKYTCTYSDLASDDFDTEGLTMAYVTPQRFIWEYGILHSALICFAMLLIFVTGIVYLISIRNFVRENILTEDQAEMYHPDRIRRRITYSSLVGALAVFAVALILLAGRHITLEIRYGRDSLGVFSDQLEEYEMSRGKEIEQREAEWYVRYGDRMASLLTECPQLAVSDKLQEFCDILNIDFIMLFDASGKETLCSKDYVGFTLENDLGENSSDFCRLLQGVPAVIHELSSDNTTGLERRFIGVKMPDGKRAGRYGALIMAVLPEQMASGGRVADANTQLALMSADGSFCFAAYNSTGEVFMSGEPSLIGKKITSIGLEKESLEAGYMDFTRLEGALYYIVTKSYNDITFYYAAESSVMFHYDYFCAAVSALLFLLGFAVLMGHLLKYYDEKSFEEWAVVSVPADDFEDTVIKEALAKRKELKAAVKDKHGEDRFLTYWQKVLHLLNWDERLPGEKAGLLFSIGFFIFLLFWMLMLFRKNSAFGDYQSMAGFLLRGDWRRGLTLLCLGGILLVATNAYFTYVICVWLLLIITTVFPGKGETVCRLLKSVVKYVSVFAVLYFSLGYLGFPVSTIVASLGIVSLALSLGAQDMVKDIIAGLFIVFEGSFHVGDYITINGTRGQVREIGVRSTKLITPVNNMMIISNHSIDSIVNLSKKASRYDLKVNVPADISVRQIEELMQRELPPLGERNDLIIGGPYYLGIQTMGSASSFGKPTKSIVIGTDCLEKDYSAVSFYVNREVALIFEREGIQLL